MREATKIYLNTWGAYNNGSIGYGWMTPSEAREFIEENTERDGGEWFIADIDNYLGVKFYNLDYANVIEVIETIETLEELEEYELDEIVALMEYLGTDNAQDAIDQKDKYIFFSDKEVYHDSCDETIECEMHGASNLLCRYFDYESFHNDCDFDIYEAANGVCIMQ